MARPGPVAGASLKAGLLAVLLAGAWYCQQRGVAAEASSYDIPLAFDQAIPPRLSRFSFVAALGGMRCLAADWVYIDYLQYYGDWHMQRDANYQQLYPMFRELLWLDPYFRFAIEDGASILGWNLHRYGQAVDLLKRAISLDKQGNRYRLFMAALTYQRFNQSKKAIRYLEYLVAQPGRSEMLMRILGSLYLKDREWAKARAYWTWVEGVAHEPLTFHFARQSLAEVAAHGY